MPPKERVAKQSRAERFFAKEEGRRVPVASGLYNLRPTAETKAVGRLLSPGDSCAVDEPLAEAIAKGFLTAEIASLREQLCIRALLARADAAAAYASVLAIPVRTDRQRKANRLAKALREFLEVVADEVDFAEYIADKTDELPDIDNERKILLLGGELTPLLDAYASEPLPEAGDATNPEVGEFFLALEEWWRESAKNTDRRGSKAVRNRIAAALWMEFGRDIPDGYSGEEWAKRQFQNWGNSPESR
ncbi:hypothetical protein SAMN04488061_1879 [Filomicrobium insigne]|uniref:Uncharacterized protein n=1 Tax=Filomicrobium insigne TaxID=418854 RepID=A0A1H0N3R1_9HYPH|nr:hypothetical protein [Filomicrobium insigne]SDO87349.1 hypothetical protein SAMN04488061_1879 [Filomicrobium insigne]